MAIKKSIALVLMVCFTSGCSISANSLKVLPQNSQTAEQQNEDFGKCEKFAKEKSDYNNTMESRTWVSSLLITVLGPLGLLSVLTGYTSPRAEWEMDAIKDRFDGFFKECMTDRGYKISK